MRLLPDTFGLLGHLGFQQGILLGLQGLSGCTGGVEAAGSDPEVLELGDI